MVLPDGQVLVTGGSDERDGDGAYDSTEAVLITGGYGEGIAPRASAWLYRPGVDQRPAID